MTDAPAGQNYNLPGNSNKKKASDQKSERPEKFEKTITGEVVQRKKSLGKRIAETFTGDDSKTVGQFVLFEVILPAAKQMISDAASQGVERLLFGGESRGGRTVSRVPYNRVTPSGRRDEPRAISQKARATHNFSEIVLETWAEAEKVLDDLTAAIEQYESATVADLLDMVGVTSTFQDNKYGWYELRDSHIRRVKEGYLLDLPRPTALD